MSEKERGMSERRVVRTADGRTLTPVQAATHDGIQRRLTWPSLHWGVEGVHPDAWPHIATAAADAILAEFDVTPRGEGQWWESLVEAPCDQGHRIFIDDGDGGVYACPACALPPTVKPSLEQVVDALAAQRPGSAEWTSSRIMQTARTILALLPGRTETEVRREAWDEVADYLDRTNAPSLAEAARRDNPYRQREADRG